VYVIHNNTILLRCSKQIKQSLEVAEVTSKSIEVASAAYKPCAERASLLYFILNDLVPIDPMYQFSLEAYMELFLISIMRSTKYVSGV
jgi:dynein heavy chain